METRKSGPHSPRRGGPLEIRWLWTHPSREFICSPTNPSGESCPIAKYLNGQWLNWNCSSGRNAWFRECTRHKGDKMAIIFIDLYTNVYLWRTWCIHICAYIMHMYVFAYVRLARMLIKELVRGLIWNRSLLLPKRGSGGEGWLFAIKWKLWEWGKNIMCKCGICFLLTQQNRREGRVPLTKGKGRGEMFGFLGGLWLWLSERPTERASELAGRRDIMHNDLNMLANLSSDLFSAALHTWEMQPHVFNF